MMLLTDSCCSGSNLCRLCFFFLYGSEITTNCKCNFYFIFFVWVAHIYQMCWTVFCCADAYQTFRWFPGFAAIKMINSAAVALYLERCAELLPQLSNSRRFQLEKNKKQTCLDFLYSLSTSFLHSFCDCVVWTWCIQCCNNRALLAGTTVLKNRMDGCLLSWDRSCEKCSWPVMSDTPRSLSTVRGPRKALWLVPARFCFTACTRC